MKATQTMDKQEKQRGGREMVATRTKRYAWTLNSPATPKLIDDYFNDFRHNQTDQFTNAAREAARVHCQRQATALRECTTDGKDNYTISDVAEIAIPYLEGFLAGCRYALEYALGQAKMQTGNN